MSIKKAMRTMNANLNVEQVQAIGAFAKQNGRTWKQVLRDAWMRGGYCEQNGAYLDACLHSLRNTHGPSWLTRFSLRGVVK